MCTTVNKFYLKGFCVFDWNNNEIIKEILEVLQHDEIVLASSDTILGLFGRLSQSSKKKLDAIKKRNLKPYIVLIQSVNLLPNFIDQDIDATMKRIMDIHWPGPLTILFKAHKNVPDWMVSAQGIIALRVPDHKGLQQLLSNLDGLFTTSANISDQPVPNSYKNIDPVILEQVKLVCCQQDFVFDGLASTILDFSSGSIKVVRLGSVVVDSI